MTFHIDRLVRLPSRCRVAGNTTIGSAMGTGTARLRNPDGRSCAGGTPMHSSFRCLPMRFMRTRSSCTDTPYVLRYWPKSSVAGISRSSFCNWRLRFDVEIAQRKQGHAFSEIVRPWNCTRSWNISIRRILVNRLAAAFLDRDSLAIALRFVAIVRWDCL